MEAPLKPMLTHGIARAIADAALSIASLDELKVSIAIVDEGGYPLIVERMDGAGLLTWKVAVEKARTAALIRAPSRLLAERLGSEPALLRLTDYLPMAGGLPIRVGEYCIGGIGVSGGNVEQDERVAAAGIAALDTSH